MTEAEFSAWASSPDAVKCILVEAAVYSEGVETVRYMSSVGYVTAPSDTPSSTAYVPCVKGGVTVNETLPLSGKASLAWGDIEVSNLDGERDSWLNDIWSGRSVQVYVGDVRWPRSEFKLIFAGVIEDVSSRNPDTVNLLLRDKSQTLNGAVTEAKLEAATLTKDTLRPLCFGEVHNVTPVLIDPGTLTYMVHDGQIEQIIEVRDNGVPVDFGVNLGNGTFSLSASPVGTITCSVQGAKTGGTYLSTVGPIIKHLAKTYGPTPVSDTDIDTAQIDAFTAAHPQRVGVYLSSRANLLDVMQQLASSVGAQVVFTLEGKLQLKKVGLPAGGGAVQITSAEILNNTLAVSQIPDLQPAVRLAYCKNYTVQAGLQTGLPPEHAELYGQEWLIVQVSDPTTADLWRRDTSPDEVQTLLQVRAEAEAEANRRLALWGVRRKVFKLDAVPSMLSVSLGDPVTIKHRRFGLSSGTTGQVIGKKSDWLGQKVTFEVLV